MLMIEVDGSVHDEITRKERNKHRTMILKHLGIKEMRFKYEEVINYTDQVIRKIEAELANNT